MDADAPKVNIYNLHSFCETVIKQHADLFADKSSVLISTLESIRLYKKLIDQFPKNHPLKRCRSDVYHEINNLRSLFAFMKREGYTVEYLHQKIDALLTELLAAAENNTSLEPSPITEKTAMMEMLRAGINEFDHYQQLLQINNRYDADDLAYRVIKTFEDNKNLLSSYQEKYKYIQVADNDFIGYPALKLLQLLMGENKQPNVMVVEYDQQNMDGPELTGRKQALGFLNKFPAPLITIKLASNSPGKELLNKPAVACYNSVSDEMAGITNKVYTLLQQNVDPKKIALICQEDEYCAAFESYFNLRNIAFYSKRYINILEQPFIKKTIQLLRYISAENDAPLSGDDLLFEILHFDFYKVPPMEIARLTVEVNSKKYSKTPTAIRNLLLEKANAPAKDLFDTGINKSLKIVSTILEKLIADASALSLGQLFENIILEALVHDYIDQSKSIDSIWLMQLLTALDDFIKNEIARNPLLQLKELIEAIDTMERELLPLPMSNITGNTNDIGIIHASEAMEQEFDYAFIVGANAVSRKKDGWLNSMAEFRGSNFNPFSGIFNEDHNWALRHLFYAAIPGNANQLFISFAKTDNMRNKLSPAAFVTEILSNYSLPVVNILLAEEELTKYAALNTTSLRPEIEQPEESFIRPILNKFIMNVSALNSYLKCPLGFYYQNIIRIPTGKNEAMEFGSAIHYALENLFKKMSSTNLAATGSIGQSAKKDLFPSVAEMVEDFKWYMQRRRIYFTNEAFERRIQYGEEVLHNYYEQYINSWNTVVSVERNIRGVTVNGVPLKGKLDKLEFDGKNVNIVDYKSGDIEKAIPKMKAPHDNEPNGGDYWRQAVFYKILVDNYEQKDWKVISTEFDFVEPDKKKEYRKEKIVITPADIETVTQQITQAWKKIQARDFYTGCGKPHCHWCTFVKENKLALALHSTKLEAATD